MQNGKDVNATSLFVRRYFFNAFWASNGRSIDNRGSLYLMTGMYKQRKAIRGDRGSQNSPLKVLGETGRPNAALVIAADQVSIGKSSQVKLSHSMSPAEGLSDTGDQSLGVASIGSCRIVVGICQTKGYPTSLFR